MTRHKTVLIYFVQWSSANQAHKPRIIPRSVGENVNGRHNFYFKPQTEVPQKDKLVGKMSPEPDKERGNDHETSDIIRFMLIK